MKIEMGKKYTTRDGSVELTILTTEAYEEHGSIVAMSPSGHLWRFHASGRIAQTGIQSDAFDLALPEPAKPVVEWGYTSPVDNVFCPCASEQCARSLATDGLRLAKRTTEIVE